jgi:hypothetical protein
MSTQGHSPNVPTLPIRLTSPADSLAVSYSVELSRFGIDTVIVVPGAFTSGTNHFAQAGHPDDQQTAAAYDQHYAGLMDQVSAKLADLEPDNADPHEVAVQIARVVDLPKGQRPFRVHIDPSDDGASTVNAVADELRIRFYERIGLSDLLTPTTTN